MQVCDTEIPYLMEGGSYTVLVRYFKHTVKDEEGTFSRYGILIKDVFNDETGDAIDHNSELFKNIESLLQFTTDNFGTIHVTDSDFYEVEDYTEDFYKAWGGLSDEDC